MLLTPYLKKVTDPAARTILVQVEDSLNPWTCLMTVLLFHMVYAFCDPFLLNTPTRTYLSIHTPKEVG